MGSLQCFLVKRLPSTTSCWSPKQDWRIVKTVKLRCTTDNSRKSSRNWIANPDRGPEMAGYSGTPLARKLGIKESGNVLAVGAPKGYREMLEPLPEGVTFHT